MARIYWHIQMNQPQGRNGFKISSEKLLKDSSPLIATGDWEDIQCENFKGEGDEGIQIGDIVMVREGDKPIALVKVASDCFQSPQLENIYKNKHFRNVDVLDWYSGKDFFPMTQGTLGRLVNTSTTSYKFIQEWHKQVNGSQDMNRIIEVLKYKKQIILQGPPGTGKTYTAEQIAKQLTEAETVSDPLALVEDFYKTFDAQKKEVIDARKEREDLREKFLQLFPNESIKDLTPEQYAIGTGERDNFCWWIERGLKPLGYYFPGSSKSYRIYWSKKEDGYMKNGSLKDKEDEAAMQLVAQNLHELAVNKNYSNAKEFFGPSYILKILNTYYPQEFLPINAENYLNHALALLNIDYKNLDFVEKNKKLAEFHLQKKQQYQSEAEIDEFAHFLLNNFNLKEGEKKDAGKVISKGAYELVQFHPAYSYEDFVRGIVVEVEDKIPAYNVQDKIMAEFAQRAIDNPKANFVLIIDEINRANLPAVLGELIYALEYRGKPVNSLYEVDGGDRSIKLPENLYIIGTMNTADRSVGHIDYAIRRRFAFLEVLPNEDLVPDFAKDHFRKVKDLFSEEYLNADFKRDDVQIGHSYFMGDKKHLDFKIKNEVVPILKEYVKDGVLKEEAEEIINTL